jgi:sugar lactone lactonase YvrE
VTYWPAIDPLTGDIWVASGFQNEYWIFKPDGTDLGAWGTAGAGPGQLALTTHEVHPGGVGAIAFAPDGTFYVADNGNNRIEEFDKDRRFVRQWGTFGTGDGQFANAKGIATDGKLVFVADDSRGDMQVFDRHGTFVRSFPLPFALFSLTSDGHLVVADNGADELVVMDTTGSVIAHDPIDFPSYGPDAAVEGSETGPTQAIGEGNGRILVGLGNENGNVGLLEVDQHGDVVHHWSTGGETMALSPDGASLYAADYGPDATGWPYFRKYALPTG